MLDVDESTPIAVLRLDHGKVNAIDVELLDEVIKQLTHLAESQCRALVVTGHGRVFSAGVDLVRVLEGGQDYVDRMIPLIGRTVQVLFQFPKPVVAAVNGAAIAGGCAIAAACDRRIVADDAPIGASEVRVGVPMPTAVLEVLRYACGDRAEAAILSGQVFRWHRHRHTQLGRRAPPRRRRVRPCRGRGHWTRFHLNRCVRTREAASAPAGSRPHHR